MDLHVFIYSAAPKYAIIVTDRSTIKKRMSVCGIQKETVFHRGLNELLAQLDLSVENKWKFTVLVIERGFEKTFHHSCQVFKKGGEELWREEKENGGLWDQWSERVLENVSGVVSKKNTSRKQISNPSLWQIIAFYWSYSLLTAIMVDVNNFNCSKEIRQEEILFDVLAKVDSEALNFTNNSFLHNYSRSNWTSSELWTGTSAALRVLNKVFT